MQATVSNIPHNVEPATHIAKEGNNKISSETMQCSLSDFTKTPTQVELNDNFKDYLKRSVVVETWKQDSYLAIMNTMDLLGFGGVEVQTMSSKSFLITFPEGTDLEEVDMDFVGLGFLNTKQAYVENLILPRKVWLEIRGLPIPAWSDDNFNLLVEDRGTVLDIAPVFTKGHELDNPKVLLETQCHESLSWSDSISVAGQTFLVNISECSHFEPTSTSYRDHPPQPMEEPLDTDKTNLDGETVSISTEKEDLEAKGVAIDMEDLDSKGARITLIMIVIRKGAHSQMKTRYQLVTQIPWGT